MLIIDTLFWLFLFRQLDKNAEEFIEETDWEQVQLQVSAETMGSFRRRRFTPYLGWWALYLFDVCHGWSVAYLKRFFFLFLGCTALRDGLSNMYHAAYIQGTLQREEPISSHCSAVVFTCVPCHVPGCIWRILTWQKTSVSRVPITLLQETSVADKNSFYSCITVISTIFSTDDDCRECKPVRTDREITLSSIWTRNIAFYFFFTYLVMDKEIFPLSSGFELLILQVLQVAG